MARRVYTRTLYEMSSHDDGDRRVGRRVADKEREESERK